MTRHKIHNRNITFQRKNPGNVDEYEGHLIDGWSFWFLMYCGEASLTIAPDIDHAMGRRSSRITMPGERHRSAFRSDEERDAAFAQLFEMERHRIGSLVAGSYGDRS